MKRFLKLIEMVFGLQYFFVLPNITVVFRTYSNGTIIAEFFKTCFVSRPYITFTYYKRAKKAFIKRLVKGVKIFLKKKKTKRVRMLVNNIEIVLKRRKIKSVNMVTNDTKISQKMEKAICV